MVLDNKTIVIDSLDSDNANIGRESANGSAASGHMTTSWFYCSRSSVRVSGLQTATRITSLPVM